MYSHFKAQLTTGCTFGEPPLDDKELAQLMTFERLCRADYTDRREGAATPVDESTNVDQRLNAMQEE